jgi:hypothetical protein
MGKIQRHARRSSQELSLLLLLIAELRYFEQRLLGFARRLLLRSENVTARSSKGINVVIPVEPLPLHHSRVSV